ncbi:MAG: FAD-dependent oxidoreductase [Planctomycetota bacterium]|nr:FAD-dependent oxidoreductase [Planctomycetota bacterium]
MSKHHVIVGGGPVATNAIETIRQIDNGESRITLISDEPAHSRMALPYWLSGQISRERTHTGDAAYFTSHGVETRIGSRVTAIDATAKSVTLCDGSNLNYDDLLIATGSSPVGLPVPGADLPGVQTLWSLADTEALLTAANAAGKTPRVLMIGAGFIGFIMLNAMHKRGWQLSVVERESQVLPRMLDDGSAEIVTSWLARKGVAVHCGVTVTGITEADDGSKSVQLDNGTALSADVVIVATGIKPNTGLIDGTGIEVDQAILVNDRMLTNVADIYCGGDVAQGPVLGSDAREVHSIQPTAVDHGRIAGANMAGQVVHYPGSLSMNILDVCGLQNSSFGQWSSDTTDVTVISNPGGSVYRKYLWQDDALIGAIFVGRPNDMGMLTDPGMVKGILQTQTRLGEWKAFLQANPFDIRRPYIGIGVAAKLTKTTLLGRPAQARSFRFGNAEVKSKSTAAHATFVGTK